MPHPNSKNWPSNAPDRQVAYQREYRRRHPERLRAKYHRDTLRRKFGMTPGQYQEILDVQGGGCAICGRTEAEEGKKLAVDHNHVNGAVRGILCSKCNWSIGHLDHDDLILRAAEYLAVFHERAECPEGECQL